jgi:Skp family chaperone for outer membrane proteins
MFTRFTFFPRGLVSAALGLALIGAASAPAAAMDPTQPYFVDLGAVYEAYKKTSGFAQYERRLRAEQEKLNGEMRVLTQVRFCTEGERKEALALTNKSPQSPEEKARLEALLKKSADVEAELAALSQKAMPSENEVVRIEEIARMRQDAARYLIREEEERHNRLMRMDQEAVLEHQADLLKVVERVAKDKKIPAILERKAILFGGNDLTDEVLKKLPR